MKNVYIYVSISRTLIVTHITTYIHATHTRTGSASSSMCPCLTMNLILRQSLSKCIDLWISLLDFELVFIVLGFRWLDLLVGIAFGFVKLDVQVLDLSRQFLLIDFPLIFILLVSSIQLLKLLLLNLHSGILLLLLSWKVEFNILNISIFLL